MSVAKLRQPAAASTMTNDELMRAIRTCLKLTIDCIAELSVLIKEARSRNLNLAEFSTGLTGRLLQVADGQLDAELLLKFSTHPALLDAVAGVPMETQKAMAHGEQISVVEHDSVTGEFVTRQKNLRQLTGPQCRLVFWQGEMLDVPAQKKRWKALHAASAKSRSPSKTDPARRVRVVADVSTGTVVVGQFKLTPDKFVTAFKALGFKIVRE